MLSPGYIYNHDISAQFDIKFNRFGLKMSVI